MAVRDDGLLVLPLEARRSLILSLIVDPVGITQRRPSSPSEDASTTRSQ